MPPPADSANFDRQLRTLQIIIGAMVMGPLIFMVITIFTPASKSPSSLGTIGGFPLLTVVGAVMAISVRLAARFAISTIETSACKKIAAGTWQPMNANAALDDLSSDSGKLLALYRQITMINAATTEGPTFFFIIAYMIERQPVSLAVALLLMADLVSRIPTRSRMEDWLESRLQIVAQNQAGA